MAIVAADLCGAKKLNTENIMKNLKNIDGRLDLVKEYPNHVKVFVDYAHTPDALAKAYKISKV